MMELTQSGQALLWGGKRSSNWQRTHDATDATEDAEAMLHTLITTYPLGMEDLGCYATFRRTAWRSWWGCTHTGDGKRSSQCTQRTLSACRRELKGKSLEKRGERPTQRTYCGHDDTWQFVPFLLDADVKTAVQKALKELNDWAREYWGPELVEIVEDDGENNTGGRPELRAPLPPQRGVEGRPEPRARVQPLTPPEAELRGKTLKAENPEDGSQAPVR